MGDPPEAKGLLTDGDTLVSSDLLPVIEEVESVFEELRSLVVVKIPHCSRRNCSMFSTIN